ncbi:MAG TPA: class II fructose-bisphosphatase [Chloroflexota bacterium]|nr:class II fructose-bisphosphatase [Chloroflexota bacterium]
MSASDAPLGGFRPSMDRNLGFELCRVTEAAAMAAARWMGRGDKNAADQAAVTAMRQTLNHVDMDGVVVIGEGEKDAAPMLYIGERVGNGLAPEVDVAVDPIDGTTLLAKGLPNALSIVAIAGRGSMFYPPGIVYMDKLAVGRVGRGVVSLEAPVRENIRNLARARKCEPEDLTICVLDRPRHEELIRQIREAGARIMLISDGDVAGAIMAAMEDYTGVDMLMGIGGAPEAVLAAAALKCLGGEIQCRLWPRNAQEAEQARASGLDLDRIYTTDDLVNDDDVSVALTGITHGELVNGVRFFSRGARTETLVMRSRSGTIRRIESEHNFEKLARYVDMPFVRPSAAS